MPRQLHVELGKHAGKLRQDEEHQSEDHRARHHAEHDRIGQQGPPRGPQPKLVPLDGGQPAEHVGQAAGGLARGDAGHIRLPEDLDVIAQRDGKRLPADHFLVDGVERGLQSGAGGLSLEAVDRPGNVDARLGHDRQLRGEGQQVLARDAASPALAAAPPRRPRLGPAGATETTNSPCWRNCLALAAGSRPRARPRPAGRLSLWRCRRTAWLTRKTRPSSLRPGW